MNWRVFVAAALATALCGCDVMVVERYPRRYAPVMVVQPAPVVVAQPYPGSVAPPPPVAVAPPPPGTAPPPVVIQPTPVVMEEGAVVGNAVVVAPAVVDGYVLVDGEWYYWYPSFGCWVHLHRPYGWWPGRGIRVYHGWGEHPRYRR